MTDIILNKKQMEKIAVISDHFSEVQHFKISLDYSSSIGVGITVSFNLFGDSDSDLMSGRTDTVVDITDISEW